MVQGINQQHVEAMLALNALNNAGATQRYNAPPMKQDSFNGKTLLTIAGVAGAIIFRKKIGSWIKKLLPNTSIGVNNDWQVFKFKHRDNFIMKGLKKIGEGYVGFENWVKGVFTNSKNAVAKLGEVKPK